MDNADLSIPPAVHKGLVMLDTGKSIAFAQLGAMCWEHLLTIPWEISVLRGKRPFQWPVLLYFGSRYSMFLCVIPPTKLDCRAVYACIVTGANAAVCFGESLLTLRALALWSRNRWIAASLAVAWLLHFATISPMYRSGAIKFMPDLELGGGSCVVQLSVWGYVLGLGYTLALDLYLVALICFKLRRLRQFEQSRITELLFRDGLAYAAATFVPAILAIILVALESDAIPRFALVPAAGIVHAILGCRAYVNLSIACDRLPRALRVKVSNGEMLDSDTLARIAFHMRTSSESGNSERHNRVDQAINKARSLLPTSRTYAQPNDWEQHDSDNAEASLGLQHTERVTGKGRRGIMRPSTAEGVESIADADLNGIKLISRKVETVYPADSSAISGRSLNLSVGRPHSLLGSSSHTSAQTPAQSDLGHPESISSQRNFESVEWLSNGQRSLVASAPSFGEAYSMHDRDHSAATGAWENQPSQIDTSRSLQQRPNEEQ